MPAITQCCRRSLGCVGVVAAVAVLTAAGPAAARDFPPSPYTFVGVTSQWQCTMNTDDPACGTVNLQMTKDMRHEKRMLIGFESPCQSGDHFFGRTMYVNGEKATKTGRNSSKVKAHGTIDEALQGGFTSHNVWQLAFSAKAGGKAKGTFSAVITVADGTGATVDTCSTGTIGYSLKAIKKLRR